MPEIEHHLNSSQVGNGNFTIILRHKCYMWLEQIRNGNAKPEDFIIWFRERIPWLIDQLDDLKRQHRDFSKLEDTMVRHTAILERLEKTIQYVLINQRNNAQDIWLTSTQNLA